VYTESIGQTRGHKYIACSFGMTNKEARGVCHKMDDHLEEVIWLGKSL